MPIDPEFPAPEAPWGNQPAGFSAPPAPLLRRARRIPNLGHTVLFLVLVGGVLFLTELGTFALATSVHLFGGETPQQLFHEPRLLIPSMAFSYILAAAISWAIFTNLWEEPFSLGVHWNSPLVKRRFLLLVLLGVALSISVQLLSNDLPIPKTLPIDDFFRTSADVWVVAIFGIFLAPPFEELVFRGFLLPSLATAWDWATQRKIADPAIPSLPGRDGSVLQPGERDPRWSAGALIFSSVLTSIAFTMLHADQLAHSWAPLSVLFAVSIVLCLVRLRAHSLAASALVHAAYNGTIFVAMFVATDGFRHLDKINT